jgi:DNA polymerase-3 subunit epsilon
VSTLFELPKEPLPDWAKKLAVFDLETTGLVLDQARIVTACVTVIDEDGEIADDQLEWLANPGIPIPEVATAVHGIDNETAQRDGRPPKDVVAEVLAKLSSFFDAGIPVVAYNAPYDFTILHYEALRNGLTPIANPSPVIDPLVIDKFLDRYRGGKRRLELTAAHYGVELTDAHNATADAVAAGRVAQAIARKFYKRLSIEATELHDLQVAWSKDLDLDFEKFMQGKDPSFKTTLGWPLKLK